MVVDDRRATQVLQQPAAAGRHVRQQRHGMRGCVVGDRREVDQPLVQAAGIVLRAERWRDPLHGPFLGYFLGSAREHVTLVLGHRPPRVTCVQVHMRDTYAAVTITRFFFFTIYKSSIFADSECFILQVSVIISDEHNATHTRAMSLISCIACVLCF